MSIKINGTIYSSDTVGKAPLGDLFALRDYTRLKGSPVSIKTINRTFERIGKEAAASAEAEATRKAAGMPEDPEAWSPLDLLDDPDFIINLIGIVYLSKRGAREEFTLDQAWGEIGFNDIEALPDEDDDEEGAGEPDPKASTALVAATPETESTTSS